MASHARDSSGSVKAALVFGHFQLGLDGAEAGFHEGVVVAVGGAVHALTDLAAPQHGPIGVAGILAAAIAVVHQARRRLAGAERLLASLGPGLARLRSSLLCTSKVHDDAALVHSHQSWA